MKVVESKKAAQIISRLVNRGAVNTAKAEPVARKILSDIRKGRDKSLRKYAERWDGLRKGQPLRVTEQEMQAAWESVSPELRDALRQAANGIRRFCEWQKPAEWSEEQQPGIRVGQVLRPLESVGCYVPGGRYPLPSTMLMTVIP